MNKIILSLILIFIMAYSLLATTVDKPTCGVFGECHVDTLRDSLIPDYTDSMNWLRIVFNVPCYDDGSNPFVTALQCSTLVDSMNDDYDSARINFNFSINWIYSTFICTTTNIGNILTPSIFNPIQSSYFSALDSQLNIFVGGSNWLPVTIAGRAGQGGVFPPGTMSMTIEVEKTSIQDDLGSSKAIISHETAHILGLGHTDQDYPCGDPCREYSREYWEDSLGYLVAEADSILLVTGDSFDDTPMNGVNADTAFVDTCSQGANVAAIADNMMKTAGGGGWGWFSPKQRGCMVCYLTSSADPFNLNRWVGTAP